MATRPRYERYNPGANLIVDEAHAVGIYGARGSGLLEELNAKVPCRSIPQEKTLGVVGAFVCGPLLGQ